MELSESIKEFGMAAPILTRPTDDKSGYEVISGQRRVRAAELAGKESVPAFVLPIDRDRAIITLVDSNIQRENILPSERAFAYKMKLDAMKRQGYRTDLRACLKSSNEDGNEGKRENLSRNIKFAFTIFPKSAEFVEPAEKTLYHPAAWQNDKLV